MSSGRGKKQKVALGSEDIRRIENCIFSESTLLNMAIYAVLEAPQEIYFGSHSEKNLNVLEKVIIRTEIEEGGNVRPVEIEKSYFSPTKQRGLERRAIAYSLVKTRDGKIMPYYKYFGLSIDVSNTYQDAKPDPRDILTFVWGATWTKPTAYIRGRVGYGGGVAIQPGTIFTKQRNRVEYRHFESIEKGKERGVETEEAVETAQMIWSKEYAEPHVLTPIYRHYMLLGVENYEPHAVAYAFLRGLELAGAGTPKGISIFEAYWLSDNIKEKVLVVDLGISLLPEPVVISPVILSISEALEEFKNKTLNVSAGIIQDFHDVGEVFQRVTKEGVSCRLIGNVAYRFLRDLAEKFEKEYLLKIDEINTPRVNQCRDFIKK